MADTDKCRKTNDFAETFSESLQMGLVAWPILGL